MKKKISVMFLLMCFGIKGMLSASDRLFGPFQTTLVKREAMTPYLSEASPSAVSWVLGRFIRGFQIFISPQDGPNCRYRPTCSQYGLISINRYGPFVGTIMASDRFLRCNPFGAWGNDPPEENYFCGTGH